LLRALRSPFAAKDEQVIDLFWRGCALLNPSRAPD
jgi:hypothetical protein